jgi:hypothetical protein
MLVSCSPYSSTLKIRRHIILLPLGREIYDEDDDNDSDVFLEFRLETRFVELLSQFYTEDGEDCPLATGGTNI